VLCAAHSLYPQPLNVGHLCCTRPLAVYSMPSTHPVSSAVVLKVYSFCCLGIITPTLLSYVYCSFIIFSFSPLFLAPGTLMSENVCPPPSFVRGFAVCIQCDSGCPMTVAINIVSLSLSICRLKSDVLHSLLIRPVFFHFLLLQNAPFFPYTVLSVSNTAQCFSISVCPLSRFYKD